MLKVFLSDDEEVSRVLKTRQQSRKKERDGDGFLQDFIWNNVRKLLRWHILKVRLINISDIVSLNYRIDGRTVLLNLERGMNCQGVDFNSTGGLTVCVSMLRQPTRWGEHSVLSAHFLFTTTLSPLESMICSVWQKSSPATRINIQISFISLLGR